MDSAPWNHLFLRLLRCFSTIKYVRILKQWPKCPILGGRYNCMVNFGTSDSWVAAWTWWRECHVHCPQTPAYFLITKLKDLLAVIVMCVQLFLFLWQSLSLMDVDEDTSGYLEFIGEFKSLSSVIVLIVILSRMMLLIPHLVSSAFIYIHVFFNISQVYYCSFIFL